MDEQTNDEPQKVNPAEAIVEMVRRYVDAEVDKLRDEVTTAITPLYAAYEEVAGRLTLLEHLHSDDYRAFVLDEARRMGVRPSELVKGKVEVAETDAHRAE
jgi:hypothetical protein